MSAKLPGLRGNLLNHPKIRALATAVPQHVMTQSDALHLGQSMFAEHFQNFGRFAEAYSNAGIEKRHICVPLEWLFEDHGWKERSDLYLEAAVNLAEEATRNCLARSGLTLDQIDGIVTVSSTGFATPSLDAHLCERLDLRRDIKRLPVFGLGCAGGVTGLARAAELAKSTPGSNWLLVVVELCSLTFRAHDKKKANIIATALFGDGAAAAIVGTDGPGPAIVASGEHIWPASLRVMGWDIEDDGFGVLFSRDIPTIVRNELMDPLNSFLAQHNKTITDLDNFLFHPGGAKVLDALDEKIHPPAPGFTHARNVMKKFGNMSAPTALFVFDEAISHGPLSNALMGALGPGFSASFVLLEDFS
jgi:alkylresorcinol/alkylpyrone synthase